MPPSRSKKERFQRLRRERQPEKTPSTCRPTGGGRIGVEEATESAETTSTSVDGGNDRWPVTVEKSLEGQN